MTDSHRLNGNAQSSYSSEHLIDGNAQQIRADISPFTVHLAAT